MNDLSHLQLFTHVVEEGSFSAAARLLGVTPSSVSRQISALEEELGARLFNRTTRTQSLTEAGEIYIRHTRRIVSDIDEAQLAVRRLADAPSGSLHVTVEADFAITFLSPILPIFLKQYPDVQVRLSMTTEVVDLVHGGIDLAIRVGHLADSSLFARKLFTSRSVLCASPDYIASHGCPKTPHELTEHECVSFRVQTGRSNWKFEGDNGKITVPILGRVNANSLIFLKGAAVDGLGIAMIPTWMIKEELENGRLITVLEDYPLDPPNTPISAVFAHNRHLAPKVRAFVDFLTDQLASQWKAEPA
ncbi:LysR family transcriptional regulator [Litoreibacter sp.]|nr:LysR family transcriptional regulator [Litoreibacter sp.]